MKRVRASQGLCVCLVRSWIARAAQSALRSGTHLEVAHKEQATHHGAPLRAHALDLNLQRVRSAAVFAPGRSARALGGWRQREPAAAQQSCSEHSSAQQQRACSGTWPACAPPPPPPAAAAAAGAAVAAAAAAAGAAAAAPAACWLSSSPSSSSTDRLGPPGHAREAARLGRPRPGGVACGHGASAVSRRMRVQSPGAAAGALTACCVHALHSSRDTGRRQAFPAPRAPAPPCPAQLLRRRRASRRVVATNAQRRSGGVLDVVEMRAGGG